MTRAGFERSSPNAHLLIGEMPAPAQLAARWREGTGLSFLVHALAFGALLYLATHARQIVSTANRLTMPFNAVYVPERGEPAGRGRGAPTVDPRQGERPTKTPDTFKPAAQPIDRPIDTVMLASVTLDALPGVPLPSMSAMPGAAARPGAGGPGSGDGPDSGPGAGPGSPGLDSGVALVPGNGVSWPELIREVRPNYTGDAMRAKVQGKVELEVVVRPDGTVDPGGVRITRSLDPTFGLDRQAVLAVSQWRFKPGTFKGQPVAVRVLVELTFTLR